MVHFRQGPADHPLSEAQVFFVEQRHRSKLPLLMGTLLVLDAASAVLTVLAA